MDVRSVLDGQELRESSRHFRLLQCSTLQRTDPQIRQLTVVLWLLQQAPTSVIRLEDDMCSKSGLQAGILISHQQSC